MSAPEAPPKRRGCFFYGCIVSIGLGLLLLVIAVGGVLILRNAINNFVQNYTDTSPLTMPKVGMPQDELDRLKARVSDFSKALDQHKKTPPLVLTAREVNALIANLHESKDKQLDGRFYISLDGDQAKGQVSLPLDGMHFPTISTKGRYLNGVASFGAAITNGTPVLIFRTLDVKGKPAPESFHAFVQAEADAILSSVKNDPKSSATLNQIESLEIKDGTVIIQPKEK